MSEPEFLYNFAPNLKNTSIFCLEKSGGPKFDNDALLLLHLLVVNFAEYFFDEALNVLAHFGGATQIQTSLLVSEQTLNC
jgi:hypothetical protein